MYAGGPRKMNRSVKASITFVEFSFRSTLLGWLLHRTRSCRNSSVAGLRISALISRRSTKPSHRSPNSNELGEPVQLRPPDRLLSPVARRHREGQHLLNRPARNVEMLRRRPRAHALGTRQANLLVKLHGIDLPTLPAAARREKWQDFNPPAARQLRPYPGLILHRRFHE